MGEYVNRCRMEFNGQEFSDFDQFIPGERTLGVQVPMMNKTGHARMTPRETFQVSAKKGFTPAFDLRSVWMGTFTVEYDSGERWTYGGVCTLVDAPGTIDGETPPSDLISFGAETLTKE